MKISDKTKKTIIAGLAIFAIIASIGMLLSMLTKQNVVNYNDGHISFEKNNLPVVKELKQWTETIQNLIKGNTNKKVYKDEMINKYYTLIEGVSFPAIINVNEDNKDLMITFNSDDIARFPISVYPKIGINYYLNNGFLSNEITSINAPYIKGSYKYFDKKWYIDNSFLTRLTKDASIIEINKIIDTVNRYIIAQKDINDSWSNVIPDTLSFIDATEFKISDNEVAYIIDGTADCKFELFNNSGRKIPCTEIKTKDGSTAKVSFLVKEMKDSTYKKVEEIWTVKNDNGVISIARPNGYLIQKGM